MLDPNKGWKESTSKSISFPEDAPDAFLTIMRIAHLKIGDVQPLEDFSDFVNIAILCDKYDTSALVSPFLSIWILKFKEKVGKQGYEEWLFIAWTFGMMATFETVSHQLVLEVEGHRTGDFFLTPGGRILDSDVVMPPGVVGKRPNLCSLEHIFDSLTAVVEALSLVRVNAVRELEEMCRSKIARYDGQKVGCKGAHNREECTTLVFGSLVKGLRDHIPISKKSSATGIYTSIHGLTRAIEHLKVHVYPQVVNGAGLQAKHNWCDIGIEMKVAMTMIVGGIPPVVQQTHIEHMRRQRAKCGVHDAIGMDRARELCFRRQLISTRFGGIH